MSEVEASPAPAPAPARGRSSTRGGRGGSGRGGPRGGRKQPNGTANDMSQTQESLDDQGELGEMKAKYASELRVLKDMFPSWTAVDLLFALQETDGDIPSTVDHITQGNVSQFAEVKKAKDRARSRVKDEPAMAGPPEKSSARGGRGRGGFESSRGRVRGSERGRGGHRGGRGGHATTNGNQKDAGGPSVPSAESAVWDTGATTAAAESAAGGWDTTAPEAAKDTGDAGQSAWSNAVTAEATPAAASEDAKSSLIPEGGAKKSWASMFAQPKPAAAPKPAPQAQSPPADLVPSGTVAPAQETADQESREPEPLLPAPTLEEPVQESVQELVSEQAETRSQTDGEELALTPSKDPLTEENVELLPESDGVHAPSTQTAASTIGSVDPRNLTPLPSQQAPIGRPPMGGYAASAYRATGVPGRSASFQRRVQEQQEAVVMPGHDAVAKAAVQFGSMGLNGEPGADPDEDREEPQTRHAPQHSPTAQPKTALPPAPRQPPAMQEQSVPEGLPTPKQAPGLPPASQHNQQQLQDASLSQGMPQEPSPPSQAYNQYYGTSQSGMQQESGALQQQQQLKPYDPFSQQAQPSSYDRYGVQSQQPQQQSQAQASFGGLSSAPNDYSSYYTSQPQRNDGYNQYYGSAGYGPQDARIQVQQQQNAGMAQQRSASGFGAGPNESAFGSQAQQQVGTHLSLSDLHTLAQACQDAEQRKKLQMEIDRWLMGRAVSPATRIGAMFVRNAMVANEHEHPFGPRDSLAEGYGVDKLSVPSNNASLAPHPLPTLHTLSNTSNLSDPQAQSRYAEAPGSGNNTPNPLMGAQQQSVPPQPQGQQSMHQAPSHQQHGGYGAGAGYPYGHPFYTSPYQQAYQSQFAHKYGGYGGGGGYPANQGGMYGGGPQGYGMGSQSSYEQHSSSPANAGAFGQNQQNSMRSAIGMSSGLGGGLDDYGRSSTQPSSHQQSSGFGGMNDPFARSTSGFGGQGGYGQQGMGSGQEDSLKPFNDAKSGPSPALGQPGRPGSAVNTAGSGQSGLPPPQQGQQSSFGGYPGFPGQANQYGGLGGLGSHQQQGQSSMGGQQSGYGGYGAGGFGQTYAQYGASRGGWGQSYGAH